MSRKACLVSCTASRRVDQAGILGSPSWVGEWSLLGHALLHAGLVRGVLTPPLLSGGSPIKRVKGLKRERDEAALALSSEPLRGRPSPSTSSSSSSLGASAIFGFGKSDGNLGQDRPVLAAPAVRQQEDGVHRRRADGPPVAQRRDKGSRADLLHLARDDEALNSAVGKFKETIYAPGSTASKDTRARLWRDFSRALEIEEFPLTVDKIIVFAAALRDAGYRSGYFYLCEIQQIHIRLGFEVTGPMKVAMADAKRGLERNLGAPTRSAELRGEWLDELQVQVESGDRQLLRHGGAPRGGLHVWGLGSGWLLREIELAHLDVHSETIRVDEATGNVTIRISTSKTDSRGRGASRTLACSCSASRRPSCAACCAKVLLEMAVGSWQGDRDSDEARQVPLVGTISDPLAIVKKADLIQAAQADAAMLHEMGLLQLPPSAVTGHFMRRSGAKCLARSGVPLSKIQWMGRWGSSAVLAYVEEAAEEAPEGVVGAVGPSWEEVREQVVDMLRAGGPSRLQADAGTQARLTDVEAFLASVQAEAGATSALAHELDSLVRPTLVLNKQTRVVHRATRTAWLDPDVASTSCGWHWARSGRVRPIVPDEMEQAGALWSRCPRCFPAGQ